MNKESRGYWAGSERIREDWIGRYRIGGNWTESEETEKNQRELKRIRESVRGPEAREGDPRDIEGLERRGVDWRQRKIGRGEDWKELDGFERNTGGLREIVVERRGVDDGYVSWRTNVDIGGD